MFGFIKKYIRKQFDPRGAFLLMGGQQALLTPDNYVKLADQGYGRNVYVYRAVNEVANAVATVPLELFRMRGDVLKEVPGEHPLKKLLKRPNPQQGYIKFTASAIAYLQLSGNSFILRVSADRQGARPQELFNLRPDRMEIIAGPKEMPIAGYRRKINGVITDKWEAQMILHLKTFHPLDDVWGLSPIRVASRSVDQNNEAKVWNIALLQNRGVPQGGFKIDGNLTKEQRNSLRESMEDKVSGAANAGRPALLEGGMEWQSFGISPAEMEWIESQKLSAKEIAMIFGVPPELIGDATNKTYSNYQEARKALFEDTATPLVWWWVGELNNWLVPLFGKDLVLRPNFDDIAVLQEELSKLWDRVSKATWLQENEKRRLTGFEDLPGLDVVLVPINLVPLTGNPAIETEVQKSLRGAKVKQTEVQTLIMSKDRFDTEAKAREWALENNFKVEKIDENEDSFRIRQFDPSECIVGSFKQIRLTDGVEAGICKRKDEESVHDPEDEPKKPKKPGGEEDKAEARKVLIWKTFDRNRNIWLDRITGLTRDRFDVERQAMVKAIRETSTESEITHTIDGTIDRGVDAWKALILRIYTAVGDAFAEQSFVSITGIDIRAAVLDIQIKQAERDIWLEEIRAFVEEEGGEKLVGPINATTKNRLQQELISGAVGGETIVDISKRIDTLYLEQIIPNRSATIARTEIIKASNAGSQAGARATGLNIQKEWLATRDTRTRGPANNHFGLDGQRIGLDDFYVTPEGKFTGEKFRFPADSAGASAGNVINCRCTELYDVIT